MHFGITGDIDSTSGVSGFIYDTSGPTKKHFQTKDYGQGLLGVGVILMCQDPKLNLKQRVEFSTQKKKLYVDVMLDLNEMKFASQESRRRIILKRILEEVPAILSRYKHTDFDQARFLDDLRAWLTYESFTWKDWDLRK